MTAGLRERRASREFLGHPRGLWVLAGTELWDRISFHGMQAILTLYLAKELLLPGRIDHVVAFGPFRHAIEALTGPLSVQALATQTFGIYIAMVYATPLVGGWVGDRFLSRRQTVTLGALLMTLGHFSLAFDQSFLFGMLFLAIGAGLLRGNLSPQVKALYPAGDRRQGDAFQLYALSVSFGAFVAPLVTGTLAAFYGWHVGFAFAGFGMLTGLVIYIFGQRYLAHEARVTRSERKPLTSSERIRVGWLLALWPLFVCFWVAQSQVWNTYNLWVSDHVDMNVGGFQVPVPWLQSLDGLMPAAAVPLMLALWRRQARGGTEPAMLVKMGIGCLIFGGSVLILVLASHVADGTGRAPILMPVAFHIFSNIGWLYFSPVVTAFLMTRAPEQTRGTFYGISALSVTAGSLISGRLGGLYEKLPASEFWLIHAAIVAGAGAVFLLTSGPLGRHLPEIVSEPVEAEPPPKPVPLPA